jgi:hypothetical protein
MSRISTTTLKLWKLLSCALCVTCRHIHIVTEQTQTQTQTHRNTLNANRSMYVSVFDLGMPRHAPPKLNKHSTSWTNTMWLHVVRNTNTRATLTSGTVSNYQHAPHTNSVSLTMTATQRPQYDETLQHHVVELSTVDIGFWKWFPPKRGKWDLRAWIPKHSTYKQLLIDNSCGRNATPTIWWDCATSCVGKWWGGYPPPLHQDAFFLYLTRLCVADWQQISTNNKMC